MHVRQTSLLQCRINWTLHFLPLKVEEAMMVLEDDSPMEAASTPSTPRNLSAWNITIPYIDFYDDDVKRERIPVFCIDVERNDRKAGEAQQICPDSLWPARCIYNKTDNLLCTCFLPAQSSADQKVHFLAQSTLNTCLISTVNNDFSNMINQANIRSPWRRRCQEVFKWCKDCNGEPRNHAANT